jgi:hypothetical protein
MPGGDILIHGDRGSTKIRATDLGVRARETTICRDPDQVRDGGARSKRIRALFKPVAPLRRTSVISVQVDDYIVGFASCNLEIQVGLIVASIIKIAI